MTDSYKVSINLGAKRPSGLEAKDLIPGERVSQKLIRTSIQQPPPPPPHPQPP